MIIILWKCKQCFNFTRRKTTNRQKNNVIWKYEPLLGWNNLNICCELIKNSCAWLWWKIGFWKITLIKSIYCKFQMDGNLIFRISCSWIGINHHSILSKISFDAKSWQQYFEWNPTNHLSIRIRCYSRGNDFFFWHIDAKA